MKIKIMKKKKIEKKVKQTVKELKKEIKEAAKEGRYYYITFLSHFYHDIEIYKQALQVLELEGFSIDIDKDYWEHRVYIRWE